MSTCHPCPSTDKIQLSIRNISQSGRSDFYYTIKNVFRVNTQEIQFEE